VKKLCLLWTLVLSTLLATAARAQSSLGAQSLNEIRIDQRIGNQLPLDLTFIDERGERVALGSLFGERPVVLALVYNACPMLCHQVLAGMLASLRTLELDAGEDFEVLVVSFDPKEPTQLARSVRDKLVERYERGKGGFHVLTGEAEPIAKLTEAVGFRYRYDDKLDQYAHASGLIVLTPKGKVARYFFGTEYSARDLRLSLVEATDGKLGKLTDELMLLCYRYDPQSGTYSASIIGGIRIGALVTLLILAAFIGRSLLRERRRRGHAAPDGRAGQRP
jgi:protein SCO1/2